MIEADRAIGRSMRGSPGSKVDIVGSKVDIAGPIIGGSTSGGMVGMERGSELKVTKHLSSEGNRATL